MLGVLTNWNALSGHQLGWHLAARALILRFGISSAAVLGMYLWPSLHAYFSKEPGYWPLLRHLRWDCYASTLAELAMDHLSYYAVWSHSRTLQAHFKSYAHALAFSNGFVPSWLNNPLFPYPRLPWADYCSAFDRSKDLGFLFYTDLALVVRDFTMRLIAIGYKVYTKENAAPVSSLLVRALADHGARQIGTWGALKVARRVFTRFPKTTYHSADLLLTWIATIALTQFVVNPFDRLLLRGVRQQRDEQYTRTVEDETTRDEETRGILEDNAEEAFVLQRMETAQFGELKELAGAVATHQATHHGARLRALQTLHLLNLYQDGVERGEMDHGAGSVLDQVARTTEFNSMLGVQTSVADLTTEVLPSTNASHTVTCAVCLEDYDDGDKLVELVCGHLFHDSCIRGWLAKHKLCPMCRHDVRARAGETDVAPALDSRTLAEKMMTHWAKAELPGDLQTADWGTVANFARLRCTSVPEMLLTAFDDDMPSQGITFSSLGCAVLLELLGLAPPAFELPV
jgi:hypothetical protein